MINYHDTYHDHLLGCLDLRPRPWRFGFFQVKRRGGTVLLLAGQLIEREPLPDDPLYGDVKAFRVRQLAVVISVSLFIKIAEQVKRLHADIVFQAIRVNVAFRLGYGVIDHLMLKLIKSFVRFQRIGIKRRKCLAKHLSIVEALNSNQKKIQSDPPRKIPNCGIFPKAETDEPARQTPAERSCDVSSKPEDQLQRIHLGQSLEAEGLHNGVECYVSSDASDTPAKIPICEETRKAFWERVDKSQDCWLWMNTPRKVDGRRQFIFKIDGKAICESAHRFSYRLTGQDLPTVNVVTSTCENPLCVRPTHLEAGPRTKRGAYGPRQNRHS